MAKIDLSALLQQIEAGVADLARREAKGYVKQAQADGRAFVEEIKADLQRWTEELVAGQITKAQFESLVRDEKDLAEMKALTAAGLAAARIQRIVDGTIDIVIQAAFSLIP